MQGEIKVLKPGMYKVVAVVFGKKRLTLQLLVNGEMVLRSGTLPSGMGQHTAARAQCHASSSSLEQPAFMCVVNEYVMLPPNACLTLLHNPQPGSSQGFLSLQKMCGQP